MATQNQGNTNVVTRTMAYDNPTYLTRQSFQASIAAGGSASSSKFYAWTQLTVWGFTLITTAVGTSTYTVNGTATTSAETVFALFVANTNTTGTSVTLATTTVGAATGPFVVGGTAPTGTNVNVGGIGGIIGGYQGPYALNTLGGTNTTQAWGTTTYAIGYPGGNAGGQGGLYMNPGDTLNFTSGTDATWAGQVVLQYSVGAPTGAVVA